MFLVVICQKLYFGCVLRQDGLHVFNSFYVKSLLQHNIHLVWMGNSPLVQICPFQLKAVEPTDY